MNLTTKARYAVIAMVDLAMQEESVPMALAQVAERQNITLNYLEQLFMKLRKADLVCSVRGPGGGYVLARKAEHISVADVVEAVDESIRMTRCSKQGSCTHAHSKCLTHNLWEGLSKHILYYLASISIQDICNRDHELFSAASIEPVVEYGREVAHV